eukprot:6111189-Amphidinium_carterae.5
MARHRGTFQSVLAWGRQSALGRLAIGANRTIKPNIDSIVTWMTTRDPTQWHLNAYTTDNVEYRLTGKQSNHNTSQPTQVSKQIALRRCHCTSGTMRTTLRQFADHNARGEVLHNGHDEDDNEYIDSFDIDYVLTALHNVTQPHQ